MKTQRYPSSLVIELSCNEDNFMEVGREHLVAMSAEIREQIVGADWLRIRFELANFEACLHFDALSHMCWYESNSPKDFDDLCGFLLLKYDQLNAN